MTIKQAEVIRKMREGRTFRQTRWVTRNAYHLYMNNGTREYVSTVVAENLISGKYIALKQYDNRHNEFKLTDLGTTCKLPKHAG